MVEQVLDYHYKYHMQPSSIDRILDLPKGTAVFVIVEEWKQDRTSSSRLMRGLKNGGAE